MSTFTTTSAAANEVPVTVIDSRDLAERFAANARAKLKLASTYAGPLIGVAFGVGYSLWRMMNPEQQAGLVGSLGLGQVWSGILIAVITHAAAVFKPAAAGAVSPQMLEVLGEVARLKLSAMLVAVGQPGIQVAEPSLTAVPAVRFVVPPPGPADVVVRASDLPRVVPAVSTIAEPAAIVPAALVVVPAPVSPSAQVAVQAVTQPNFLLELQELHPEMSAAELLAGLQGVVPQPATP